MAGLVPAIHVFLALLEDALPDELTDALVV
jgi:hypothetical protein